MMATEIRVLRERLDLARRDLLCADMIDSFARRQREMQRIQTNINEIEREIAELEARP